MFKKISNDRDFLVGIVMSSKEGVMRSKDRGEEGVASITPKSFFRGIIFRIIADRERDIMGRAEGMDKRGSERGMVITMMEMKDMDTSFFK